MKKLLAIVLVLTMVATASACSCNGISDNQKTDAPTNNTGGSQPSGTEGKTDAPPEKTNEAENAKLDGKLYLIELDDRDPSILRGVIIKGNLAGTVEFNGRESSLTDVRCIFELQEWVEFYPDTDATYGLRVWILKHRDDQEYYNTCKFSDLMPNFAQYCDLHYPEDAENPGEYQWGSFYLHPEECEPGYYDFVFTYEGKAIATLLTRFYKEGELIDKSDAELEKLMRE